MILLGKAKNDDFYSGSGLFFFKEEREKVTTFFREDGVKGGEEGRAK